MLLRSTLRQLGVSDVNMDEGSLRADANVSVRPAGTDALGTKTELKNMNSFRFLERGIEAELQRQRERIASGAEVQQETLHFDPQSGTLTPLRSKEEAQDYRYFPEPDLPPLEVTPAMVEAARADLPELPADRQQRYEAELGLNAETARLLAFREGLGPWFERGLATGDAEAQPLATWITQDLAAALGGADPAASKVEPEALAALVGMVTRKEVNASAGKAVLEKLAAGGGDPKAIVEAEGLGAMGDGDELEGLVQAAIDANPDAAEKIRAGKQQAVGAIIGHVMRETKGRADGGEVSRIVREKLGV
jgi:aspartyl-tRNA(Asn)/glutamyl-tRNA(Gln) amidotransferase subunit B